MTYGMTYRRHECERTSQTRRVAWGWGATSLPQKLPRRPLRMEIRQSTTFLQHPPRIEWISDESEHHTCVNTWCNHVVRITKVATTGQLAVSCITTPSELRQPTTSCCDPMFYVVVGFGAYEPRWTIMTACEQRIKLSLFLLKYTESHVLLKLQGNLDSDQSTTCGNAFAS